MSRGSPGFNTQHHIYQAWWLTPVILALKGRDRKIRNSKVILDYRVISRA